MDWTQKFIDALMDQHVHYSDLRGSMPVHATKQWQRRDPAGLKGAVYHQSLENYGKAENVAKYHVGPNHISDTGLPGLSYTGFVEKNGCLVIANDVEAVTYSQGDRTKPGDENVLYVGFCFGGNFSGTGYVGPQEPTVYQLNTAIGLWLACKRAFGFTNDQLFGHYDFGKPACPGYALQNIIETVNKDVDWGQEPDIDLNSTRGRQQALKELGFYTGPVDGAWGNGSKTALVKFQQAKGLDPDGLWGKKTAAAVIKAYSNGEATH